MLAGAAGVGLAALGGSRLAGAVPRARITSLADQLERSVIAIGDSITAESEDLLHEILRGDGFSRITIDAERSRRIEVGGGSGGPRSGISVLSDLTAEGLASTASAWIIALGTNDIGSYATGADFADLVNGALFFVPQDAPLVWVNTYLPDRLEACRVLNAELDRIMRRRGNAMVASWYDANSVPGEDLLRSDRIHPNDRGHVVFATLMATTLRRLLHS